MEECVEGGMKERKKEVKIGRNGRLSVFVQTRVK